jgi:hypothetical protein
VFLTFGAPIYEQQHITLLLTQLTVIDLELTTSGREWYTEGTSNNMQNVITVIKHNGVGSDHPPYHLSQVNCRNVGIKNIDVLLATAL